MKRQWADACIDSVVIEEKNPLKQGLKLCDNASHDAYYFIEEKNPLKQGLKLDTLQRMRSIVNIEEKNPLKQGLKRCSIVWENEF